MHGWTYYDLQSVFQNKRRSRAMTTKELTGKVACITGAAGGIGLAIAMAFAEVGANLALLDLNEEGLAHLAQEAREKRTPPVSVRTAVADLSTEQGVTSG